MMKRSLRVVALDYLARREHTRVELTRKLQKKDFEHGEIVTALDRLRDDNLQSDQRFAESYAEQRAGRGYGPLKIIQELKQRGVDDVLAEQTVAQLPVDWHALAAAVKAKKSPTPPRDPKEKAKLQRFMWQRGFNIDSSTSKF